MKRIAMTFRIIIICLSIFLMLPQMAQGLPEGAVDRLGKGHISSGDRTVTFSPDGSMLAVLTSIGVYLYDSNTLDEIHLFESNSLTFSLAFSPDGTLLATGSGWLDSDIKVWEVSTGQLKNTLMGHNSDVNSVSFSPDGALLASGSDDRTVKVWDVSTGQLRRTLTGHNGFVNSVSFSPDGALLASGVKAIKVWNVSTGQLRDTLTGHIRLVSSVSFSPDGSLLASGSYDDTVKVWDVSTGQLRDTLTGHKYDVYSVSFSPDGSLLASGSLDNTVKVWEVSTGQLRRTLTGHTDSVYSVSFSPDGALLASGGFTTVKVWEVSTGQLTDTLTGHYAWIYSVSFSPDGTLLASGSAWPDYDIKVWEVSTGQLRDTLMGHTDYVRSVSFSPDGTLLASGSHDDTVKLWEVSTGQLRDTLTGHTGNVNSVSFSPDGSLLASGSLDSKVKLWEVSTGQLMDTLTGHSFFVNSVSFSPDGSLLASGSADDTIKLWEVSTGQLRDTLTEHTGNVYSVSFSPDGALLASGSGDAYSGDNTVKLWDVSTGQLMRTLTGHKYDVTSVSFNPDGSLLASGSADRTVKLWEVSTGKLRDTLIGHTSSVSSVSFSPDGALLASGSHDGTALLWGTPGIMNMPPFAPELVSPANGMQTSDARPVFTWNIPSDSNDDPLHFRVEIDNDSDFGDGTLVYESMNDTTGFDPVPPVAQGAGIASYTPQLDLPAGHYWWHVTAWDGEVYGDASDTWQFTVDTEPPVSITDLEVINQSPDSILLRWKAPGDDGNTGTASVYDIRHSSTTITADNWDSCTQCTGEPVPQAAGSQENFTVTGLSSKTTYYLGIKSGDDVSNWSGISNIVEARTTSVPPGIPILSSPPNGQNTYDATPTLTWNVPPDEEGDPLHFRVEIDDDDGIFGDGTLVYESRDDTTGFDPIPPVPQGTGTASYTPQSDLPAGDCWWRVSAWDGEVYGAPSDTWQFTVEVFYIDLFPGRNLISLCLDVINKDISAVLWPIREYCRSVYCYDATSGTWKCYFPGGPPELNSLDTMEHGKGYVVDVTQSVTLSIAGTPIADTGIQLHHGLNIVGCNSLLPVPRQDGLQPIDEYYDGVCTYSRTSGNPVGTWLIYSPDFPDFLNNFDEFKPGSGYCIFVNLQQGCIWDIGAVIP